MSTATMHKNCIEACYQCLIDCENCLSHMMQMDKMQGSDCPACCRECVQICHLLAGVNYFLPWTTTRSTDPS